MIGILERLLTLVSDDSGILVNCFMEHHMLKHSLH